MTEKVPAEVGTFFVFPVTREEDFVFRMSRPAVAGESWNSGRTSFP
ncbi:hypothetical protein [Amycolatopsis sp. NPDC021455]